MRKCCSDNPKQIPAARNPEVSIALRFFANLGVRGVLLEHLFERRRRFHLVFHNNAIEFAGYVGENAVIREIPSAGHFFQLSRQLARLSWLGGETVPYHNHELSPLS